MVEKFTGFKSEDGEVFDTEEEAADHEAEQKIFSKARKEFSDLQEKTPAFFHQLESVILWLVSECKDELLTLLHHQVSAD